MTYRTDFRRGKEAVNLMMTESANVNLTFKVQDSIINIASRIDAEIRARFEKSPTHRGRLQADQFGGFDVVSDPYEPPRGKFADVLIRTSDK
jgi:hypothetical protein